MFDPTVIGTTADTLDQALAIRASLELFRLRAHLYLLCQKRNLLDFLAGRIADSDYVVLCCHGYADGDPPEAMGLRFNGLTEEVEGKWQEADGRLPVSDLRELVCLPGRTVIATGCHNGREPIARAFLDAGCRAYMGAADFVDQDAGPLFAITFFYHLLRHGCDPGLTCTDEQAAALAAAVDTASREGTHLFRYYSAETVSP